jgi:hypothetical protein
MIVSLTLAGADVPLKLRASTCSGAATLRLSAALEGTPLHILARPHCPLGTQWHHVHADCACCVRVYVSIYQYTSGIRPHREGAGPLPLIRGGLIYSPRGACGCVYRCVCVFVCAGRVWGVWC